MAAGVGPQDYPDWVRLQQQSAQLAFNLNLTADLGIGTSAWIYVGNSSHLLVGMSTGPSVVLAQVQFNFANNSDGTSPGGVTTAWCDLTHKATAIIPVMGNFVQMVASSALPPGSGQAVAVYGEGVSYVPRPGLVANPVDSIRSTFAAVAVGAVVTADMARTVPGLWIAQTASAATPVLMVVEQEYTNTVWTEVAGGVSGATNRVTMQVALAAAPTRIRAQNNAAAPADLALVLTPIG